MTAGSFQKIVINFLIPKSYNKQHSISKIIFFLKSVTTYIYIKSLFFVRVLRCLWPLTQQKN